MSNDEPMFRCTICGQVGTVGRCCGTETRIPLNDAASRRQQHDSERNTETDALDLARKLEAYLRIGLDPWPQDKIKQLIRILEGQ